MGTAAIRPAIPRLFRAGSAGPHFGVVCVVCRGFIPIAPDQGGGLGRWPYARFHSVIVICGRCGDRRVYGYANLRSSSRESA